MDDARGDSGAARPKWLWPARCTGCTSSVGCRECRGRPFRSAFAARVDEGQPALKPQSGFNGFNAMNLEKSKYKLLEKSIEGLGFS